MQYCVVAEWPSMALTARNLANSEIANPAQDIVATCAAYWLATREISERLREDEELMKETTEALAVAGLNDKADQKVRHMVEVMPRMAPSSICRWFTTVS